MTGLLGNPPLSLYVHMPWCVRKCPYCDFNSHAAPEQLPADDYVRALISDLEHDLPLIWGRPVKSIYFGGGTPSLFSADLIGKFLSEVRAQKQPARRIVGGTSGPPVALVLTVFCT